MRNTCKGTYNGTYKNTYNGTYKNTYNGSACGSYGGRSAGIDVLAFVQGNTVRVQDHRVQYHGVQDHRAQDHRAQDHRAQDHRRQNADACAVYDFSGPVSDREALHEAAVMRHKTRVRRKNAARARRRAFNRIVFRTAFLALLLTIVFGIGGMVSKAQSKKVPEAYKYYDTITVAYEENLLDIVERYDDRAHYASQFDYVEELCRINNIAYDGTGYPEVAPGTHLVVPYYSMELK